MQIHDRVISPTGKVGTIIKASTCWRDGERVPTCHVQLDPFTAHYAGHRTHSVVFDLEAIYLQADLTPLYTASDTDARSQE